MSVPAPRYLLCLLYLFVVLCAPARASTLDDANQAARRFMATTMKERGIPAMQVAVVKDGRVVFSEVSGLANVENQIAATRSTLFPINSATKAFTGVAMMQLVEAGQVDLDAPISTYLQQLPSAWQGIRVRQLLAHTSGLPDIVDGNGLVGGLGSTGLATGAAAANAGSAGGAVRLQPDQLCAACHDHRSAQRWQLRRLSGRTPVRATGHAPRTLR